MQLWSLLVIAVAAVVSRRCVTHHEAGALLRDHKLEGELTEAQIKIIRTGAIYTKLRRRGTGAAAALDTALLRNNKITLPASFRRFTQYTSTPQQVQADAEAWIDARILAREWTRLSAKNAYDIFATRHSQAGGANEDLWLCVRDKLLQCAFEDRLQRGPVHARQPRSRSCAVQRFSVYNPTIQTGRPSYRIECRKGAIYQHGS